jgi:hypothetical protein
MDGIVETKQWWEIKHDWICEDLCFEDDQLEAFLILLRQHPEPDDKLREGYLNIINNIKKNISIIRKQYKEIYGVNPKHSVYSLHKQEVAVATH